MLATAKHSSLSRLGINYNPKKFHDIWIWLFFISIISADLVDKTERRHDTQSNNIQHNDTHRNDFQLNRIQALRNFPVRNNPERNIPERNNPETT